MKMATLPCADGQHSHLGYCTNIHAAEQWTDIRGQLEQYLPRVKSQLQLAETHPAAAMGVGLRLSAAAVTSLGDEQTLQDLLSLLGDDFYVYTINAFPYGAFHNTPVKEQVYAPDWSIDARLDYSNDTADILAKLLPENEMGTISSVPGTFKAWAPGRVEGIAQQLLQHVAHLVSIRRDTGKHIMMTLEPEPCCMLETIEESIDFFEQYLLSKEGVSALAKMTTLKSADAEIALREHLGLCYDVCHAAVEFENPQESIQALADAGISIGKLQISSALRLPEVTRETHGFLEPFDEPVYLHQVVQKKNGELTRFVDLGEALASIDEAIGSEWRCHFHVPVFLKEMSHFSTTQDFLRDILAIQKRTPFTRHLEVETYTWDVLPESYKDVSIDSAIARELNWVTEQLQL